MPRVLTDEVLEFRSASVSLFILAAAAAIQSVDRRLQSLVLPTPRMPGEQRFPGNERLGGLAESSGVDGLCIMVPWQDMGWDMEYALREALERADRATRQHDKGSALWVVASPHPEDRAIDTVEFAARVGAQALVISDYASLVEAPEFPQMMPSLREALHRVAAVR